MQALDLHAAVRDPPLGHITRVDIKSIPMLQTICTDFSAGGGDMIKAIPPWSSSARTYSF